MIRMSARRPSNRSFHSRQEHDSAPPELYRLGVAYFTGAGKARDIAKAVRLFHLSAAQGYASAQNRLGHMYLMGSGVERDVVQALEWFLLARDQGKLWYVDSFQNLVANLTPVHVEAARLLSRRRRSGFGTTDWDSTLRR